jgi:hypothetical protein
MIVSSQDGACNLQKLKTNTQREQGFKMLGTNLQSLEKHEFQIENIGGTKNKPFAQPEFHHESSPQYGNAKLHNPF